MAIKQPDNRATSSSYRFIRYGGVLFEAHENILAVPQRAPSYPITWQPGKLAVWNLWGISVTT